MLLLKTLVRLCQIPETENQNSTKTQQTNPCKTNFSYSWRMPNPRRNSNPNNPFESHLQSQSQSQSLSLSSLIFFLKRPQAFPFLLSIFLFLTWVSLRFQKHQAPQHFNSQTQHQSEEVRKGDDVNANLVRFSSDFPSLIIKDKRGWLLNPVIAAKEAGVLGQFLVFLSFSSLLLQSF